MSTLTGSVDDIDITLMQMADRGHSVREMGSRVSRSPSTVFARLEKLEDLGLLKGPPSKGMHRLYRTTDFGRGYLHANLGAGFVHPDMGPDSTVR